MIYAYGVTEQGPFHKENGTVCQDAHAIIKRGEMAVAAVADGLGSASCSDIASKIAARVSARHCAEHITGKNEPTDIIHTIQASFLLAREAIEKEACKHSCDASLYDTTLTLAALINDTLYYGHSGDGGIIALTLEGRYEQVTKQQRDADNNVFPLYFSDKWIFDRCQKKVCSVLLATDGMYDTFFPLYLRNEPVSIYIALARFFMDNHLLYIDEAGEENVQARMEDFIRNIPAEQVKDDKTVAVLVNAAAEPEQQPEAYYKEPDWEALKRKWEKEWKRSAYPHLYK